MGNELMAPRKNRFNRNPESEVIAQSVIEAYKPSTVEDMQAALREVFGPMFEAMPKAELDAHLGYAPNSKGGKATGNRRNGYSKKKWTLHMAVWTLMCQGTGTGLSSPLSSLRIPMMPAGSKTAYGRCMPVG